MSNSKVAQDRLNPRSSNLENIDETQDPLASLTSSLQSDYMDNFGIFDSLTLAKQRMRLINDFEGEAAIDLDPEEEDDAGAAWWRELDSSLENIIKEADPITSSVRHGSSTRRSGVRRGHKGVSDSSRSMKVPTKYNDGPSSSVTPKQKKILSPAA